MPISQYVSGLLKRSRRYAAARKCASQRGVSAVEFAMIAPLMVLLLFGSAEASLAVTVDRKTTLAASTLGDLAAQTDAVSCTELAQIGAVTRLVFEPYSGVDATMVVASLRLDGTAAKVEWSKFLTTDTSAGTIVCNDVPPSHPLYVNKIVTIDPALFAPGGGLVVGDVEMVHKSIGTSFLANNLKLQERFYLRPRKSLKLKFCTNIAVPATCT
jgi:Flp pilus assembly protein TadG